MIIFYILYLVAKVVTASTGALRERPERSAMKVSLPSPFYRWRDQGSYEWASCLVLHTVKPEFSPRASKSTATPFPEPEEAHALQLNISWYCYRNLVLVYSEIKITKDLSIAQDLSCWQPESWDYGPKADKLELGPTLTMYGALGKWFTLSGLWAPNLQMKGVRLEIRRDC